MYTFNSQAIESTHSMTNPLNVYIQWLSTFNTTYINIEVNKNLHVIRLILYLIEGDFVLLQDCKLSMNNSKPI